MANPIMSVLGNVASKPKAIEIATQAFWAFTRGEDPTAFLKKLGQTEPEVNGLDLTDINAAAQKLCRDRNVDPKKLTQEITQFINNMK